MNQDKAADQLADWKQRHWKHSVLVNSHGVKVPSVTTSLTVGDRGPILLQDTNLTEHLANFNRERIPERVVHAKGAGAFGHFEVTNDISEFTKATVFRPGTKTRVAVRFSTVGGESGSADTVRDPRGFAVKFYTDDGNWDLVGNNTPIFFIRDPILFPSFIHTQKRNPETHLKDPNMVWDFQTLRPETTHQFCFLFSDRGIPDGHRHMHGYGSHTFKLVNAQGLSVYCKFHLRTNQGIKNLPVSVAHQISADDPDYSIHDLYNAIAQGNFPSWSLSLQVMTFDQAAVCRWNPFDVTKIWPHSEYPLIPVGNLTLNENPSNYHQDVEVMAFSPANLIPGIEPSPDKMLQGRLFAYLDTHRHRLGPNYAQLPVNSPKVDTSGTTSRGGFAPLQCPDENGGPNYFPNSFSDSTESDDSATVIQHVTGDIHRYDSSAADNHFQVTTFWTKVLSPEERQRLVDNIVSSLVHTRDFIQARAVQNFAKVHTDFGHMVEQGLITRGGVKGHMHSHHFHTETATNSYKHETKSNL